MIPFLRLHNPIQRQGTCSWFCYGCLVRILWMKPRAVLRERRFANFCLHSVPRELRKGVQHVLAALRRNLPLLHVPLEVCERLRTVVKCEHPEHHLDRGRSVLDRKNVRLRDVPTPLAEHDFRVVLPVARVRRALGEDQEGEVPLAPAR
jgi:hypothetical protein